MSQTQEALATPPHADQSPLKPPTEQQLLFLQAWIDTRMSIDRSLLTLSAGGLALLAGIISTRSDPLPTGQLWLLGLATLFFLATLVVVLEIFRRNAIHIEESASGKSAPDAQLGRLDKLARACFCVAALLTVCSVYQPHFHRLLSPHYPMTQDHRPTTYSPDPSVGTPSEERSLNGIGNVIPSPSSTQQSSEESSSGKPSSSGETPQGK